MIRPEKNDSHYTNGNVVENGNQNEEANGIELGMMKPTSCTTHRGDPLKSGMTKKVHASETTPLKVSGQLAVKESPGSNIEEGPNLPWKQNGAVYKKDPMRVYFLHHGHGIRMGQSESANSVLVERTFLSVLAENGHS